MFAAVGAFVVLAYIVEYKKLSTKNESPDEKEQKKKEAAEAAVKDKVS